MCVSIVIIWMYFYLVFHMNDLHIIWCDQQSNANFTYVIYIYHASCRDVIKYFVNQSVSLLVLCEGYAMGVATKLFISKAWTVNGEVIYWIHSVKCGEAKMTRYIVPNILTSSFVIADICKIHYPRLLMDFTYILSKARPF